jgi:hypothetical protein
MLSVTLNLLTTSMVAVIVVLLCVFIFMINGTSWVFSAITGVAVGVFLSKLMTWIIDRQNRRVVMSGNKPINASKTYLQYQVDIEHNKQDEVRQALHEFIGQSTGETSVPKLDNQSNLGMAIVKVPTTNPPARIDTILAIGQSSKPAANPNVLTTRTPLSRLKSLPKSIKHPGIGVGTFAAVNQPSITATPAVIPPV